MKSSNILIQHIKEAEGVRLTAYKCPAGVWTIGVGHTKGVVAGQKITMSQAESFLRSDLLTNERYINDTNTRYKLNLTQGQFDALVDFCYNVGNSAFGDSTLMKKVILRASYQEIKNAFLAWNKARVKGKLTVLSGLTKRREWEANRWLQ